MIININGTQVEIADGLSQEQIGQFVDEVAPTLGQQQQPSPASAAGGASNLSEEQTAFNTKFREDATATGAKIGVQPETILAVMAQESGWSGKAKDNNYFNIKGSGGRTTDALEYDAEGNPYYEPSTFKGYANAKESMDDYVAFLRKNPRYSKALKAAESGDDEAFLREVHAAGYATDPSYSDNIINIRNTLGGSSTPATPPSTNPSEQYGGADTVPSPQATRSTASTLYGTQPPAEQQPPQGGYSYQTRPDQGFKPNQGGAVTPTGASTLDAIGQGVYGLGDEVQSAIEAVISGFGPDYLDKFGLRYDKELAVNRARIDKERASNPTAFATAEALTALSTGGALFKGVNALSRAGNLGKVATGIANLTAAGVEGAVAGQGYSRADIGTPANITDTAYGTGFGLLGGAVGEFLQMPFKALVNRLTKVDAKDIVARELLAAKPSDISIPEYASDLKNRLGMSTPEVDSLTPTTPSVNASRDVVRDPNMQAALADLPQLTGITADTVSAVAPTLAQREALKSRATDQAYNIADYADPYRTKTTVIDGVEVPTVVAGRKLTEGDFIDDIGMSELGRNDARNYNPNANLLYLGNEKGAKGGFANLARQEGNVQAQPFYDEAYASQPTTAQIQQITQLSRTSPIVARALQDGSVAAKGINTEVGVTAPPTVMQVLDEAGKSISRQMSNSANAVNPNPQSMKALQNSKKAIDDIAYSISPALAEARRIGAPGQQALGNINTGYGGLGATEGQSFATGKRIADDPVAQQQVALGAGRQLRERVEAWMQSGTAGKAINAQETRNLNRYLKQPLVASDLEGLVSSAAVARDTLALANRDPKRMSDALKSRLPKDFKDAASVATFVGTMQNLGPMMISILSQRLGQSTIARLPRRELSKRVQTELLTLGVTAKDIDNLLTGQFNKINPETLAGVVSGLPRLAGIEITQDFAEQ